MNTVKQILTTKGNQIWSISSDKTVYEALEKMAAQESGALMVVDNDQVVGIITERDYARKIILRGVSSPKTQIKNIMSTRVTYVTPTNTVEECMALMTDKRCRHLPVMDKGKLVGLLSIGDLVKASIAHKEFLIHQLENYISGDFTAA